jgi:hypothetical protein
MNQHYTQTKDALYNPKNPVNPDSKPGAYLYKTESIYLSINQSIRVPSGTKRVVIFK